MTLWGMWKRWELPIHVAVPGDHRRTGIRVHLLHSLIARDIDIYQGLRVTSPARTLLDMAPSMPDAALKRRVNEARRAEVLALADIADVVQRFPRQPGARRLRPLLEVKGGPTRSEWEDAFPAFCKQYDLPHPVLSQFVAGYEADAVFPDEKIVIELDSWEFHKHRDAFELDRDRDADRLAAGYWTVRIPGNGSIGDRRERLPACTGSSRSVASIHCRDGQQPGGDPGAFRAGDPRVVPG